MRKRILAFIMAIVVITTTVSPIAMVTAEKNEESIYISYYEDYLRALDDRCSDYQEYLSSSTGTGQYALLFELRILSAYMMYAQFMIQYDSDFGAGVKTNSEIYEQDLSMWVNLFNESYGEKSEDFKELKLEDNFDGINHANGDSANKKANEAFKKNIIEVIPNYLKELLKDIQDEITTANGNQKTIKRIKKQNATLVSNIYAICEYVLEAKSDLAAYTPIKMPESTQPANSMTHKKYTLEWKDVTVEEAYNGVFADYPDLLAEAQKLNLNEATQEEIEIDLTKPLIENLSNAVVMDGNVEMPKIPHLTLLYYAIMAASSVYVPLQSYAGSTEFQEALKSLTNDKEVQAEMLEFYSVVKDLRKPLYKREINADGVPDGTANIVTIQDFVDDIKNGNSGAYCTILGDFIYDSESGSWVYKQSDFRTSDADGESYDAVEDNSQSTISVTDSSDVELLVEDSFDPTSNDVDVTESTAQWVSPTRNSPNTVEEEESTTVPATTTITEKKEESTTVSSSTTETNPGVVDNAMMYAYTEITDDTKMSEAVYLYGVDYYREDDNLTAMLLYNVIANSANLQFISDKSTRYLYMNAFGDIVTDDNLIVFPGIANPILYRDTESYNPYTAAFMNSYPMCYKTSSVFKLTNKMDIGKYIIVKQAESKPKAEVSYYAVKTNSISSIQDAEPIRVRKMYLNFSVDGSAKEKLLKYQRLIFGAETQWTEKNKVFSYTPLVSNKTAKVAGSLLFPYVTSDDTPDKEAAKAIAQNLYWYLTSDTKTGKQSETTKFNENYILHYFLNSGLGGTNNPKGYSQNTLEQYTKYVKNAPERFLSSLKGLSENIWNFTSSVQGVIGLRESMQSPILGTILMVCRSNLIFFFLLATIFLVVVFARRKLDLFQLLIKLVVSLLVSYCCITVVPTYLPMLFNVVINNVSENLTYKVLALRTEGEAVGILEEKVDENGEAVFNSESITLYKAGVLNYEDFVKTMGGDESELIGGKIKVVNQNAGIFAEGDSIKVSTSKLFSTLKIRKHNGADKGYYRLKAYKTVSNNVDYYTPFYQFTDEFIQELNQMNKIYDISKNVITYSNGVMKENFMVYSFINSPIFLTPGEYETNWYTEGLDAKEIEALQSSNARLTKKLEKAFGGTTQASDFLRMTDWIAAPTEAMKKTLWCQTMQNNGYFDEKWNPDYERLNALVDHVNYQVRKFIFEMEDQIGQLSDETMIKLIALRATIDFNQQISEFGHWVYPFSLNYGDFTLGDVASAVFVSEYGKYVSMDFNAVTYVGDKKGWFPLLVMDILLVLMFIVVYVVQLLLPVMYVLLCLTIIGKLIMQGDTKIPIKGFTKCMTAVMAGYSVFALGLALVEKLNGSVVSIYAILAICFLLLYVLFAVISALVFNLADMGNETINAKFSFLSGSQKSGRFSNQFVSNLRAKRSVRESRQSRFGYRQNYDNPYSYNSSVDAMYGGYDSGWGGNSWQEQPYTQTVDQVADSPYSEVDFSEALADATINLDSDFGTVDDNE